MVVEILQEKGFEVDVEGFQLLKTIQKEKNRGSFQNKNAFEEVRHGIGCEEPSDKNE